MNGMAERLQISGDGPFFPSHDKRTNEQIMNIRLFSGILKEKRMGCYERSVRFCKYGDGS